MVRLRAFIRRAFRIFCLRNNPFDAYQLISDIPYRELEVVMTNEDRVIISMRCKKLRTLSGRRRDDVREFYEISAVCSDTAPESLRAICDTVLVYPRVRNLQLRESDISEVLIGHYLQVLNYQLTGV